MIRFGYFFELMRLILTENDYIIRIKETKMIENERKDEENAGRRAVSRNS